MLGIQILDNALSSARDADRAQKLVGVERRLTQHFGQAPGSDAAIHLHLPQAVLRVRVTEREGRIAFVRCDDGRNAMLVAIDAHRLLQTRQR